MSASRERSYTGRIKKLVSSHSRSRKEGSWRTEMASPLDRSLGDEQYALPQQSCSIERKDQWAKNIVEFRKR